MLSLVLLGVRAYCSQICSAAPSQDKDLLLLSLGPDPTLYSSVPSLTPD